MHRCVDCHVDSLALLSGTHLLAMTKRDARERPEGMNTKQPWFIYGTAWKKERTAGLVEAAVKAGFTAIDTANQAKHYSESLVGEALLKLSAEGVTRGSLFLQTKFTPVDGQDSRLPYDPAADIRVQVEQSLESSLLHLHTDYLDSYLLHGPYNHPGLGVEDWECWGAMEEIYRAGVAKRIGISNVNAGQLELLVKESNVKPMVVQNRCYASRGWDKDVRTLCREYGILYEGFSLLTANPEVLGHPQVRKIAARLGATPEQVIFRFAMQVQMIPLTGTTDHAHMSEDLKVAQMELTAEEVSLIETITAWH
jgi:diketogulonate reductase-like aldo/keto reductase